PWPTVLALPLDDRLRALADPHTRALMAEGIDERRRSRPSSFFDFERMTVQSVASPSLKPLEGRRLGDIARGRTASALDAFLDIPIDDQLLAGFVTAPAGDDVDSWEQRAEYWRDPRVLVGASDAGAHLDMLTTFGFFTDFVGPTVRDRHLLSLEEAVRLVPAAPP